MLRMRFGGRPRWSFWFIAALAALILPGIAHAGSVIDRDAHRRVTAERNLFARFNTSECTVANMSIPDLLAALIHEVNLDAAEPDSVPAPAALSEYCLARAWVPFGTIPSKQIAIRPARLQAVVFNSAAFVRSNGRCTGIASRSVERGCPEQTMLQFRFSLTDFAAFTGAGRMDGFDQTLPAECFAPTTDPDSLLMRLSLSIALSGLAGVADTAAVAGAPSQHVESYAPARALHAVGSASPTLESITAK